MNVIPQEIPDLGNSLLAPRQNPAFMPGAGFTTEDYFVWSRLDGRTSLREIILMVGIGIEKSIGILRKLRRIGAVLMPGEEPAQVAAALARAAAQAPARAEAKPEPEAAARELSDLSPLTAEEERAMAETVALEEAEKRRIIQMMRLVAGSDYFALLGVGRDADKRAIKRAYYRLSKEFHPDRHYKQNLGTFGPLLHILFESATVAFETLSDDERRADYLAALATAKPGQGRVVGQIGSEGSGPVSARRAASPADRARIQQGNDLFARGCEREIAGDTSGALRMFRAALQADPQPRYLRRAAKCALGLGQLREAEAYAEKAVSLRGDDASYARLMADVLRAADRLEEAEQTLLRALDLPSTSDALVTELESDLSEVRSARAARAQG